MRPGTQRAGEERVAASMGNAKSLLQIIESNLDTLKTRVAQGFRGAGREVYETFTDEELETLAWSHLDPIIQSLRFEDDFLFTFFLDYASGRSAEQGLPIEDSLLALNILAEELWTVAVAESADDELKENLRLLSVIISKGKDGIAGNYLSQRDKLLEELRRSNGLLMEHSKRKMDFLAKVSHELKTPLTSIIAYSEQLRNGDVPPVIQAEFIQVIHEQSTKLFQLIEDLLDLSKAGSEQSHLNLAWSDLASVLEEAIGTVQARAVEKGVKLVLHEPGRLPRVFMDPFRIQQVVWNLLTNAVKYNHGGGVAEVSARHAGDRVEITVADDGIGIGPEDLEAIWQGFHQTDEALALKEGGAGLGLDIARQFVHRHGGRIWVESELGKGSTFTFSIPVAGPDGQEDETPSPERERADTPAERERADTPRPSKQPSP